MRRLETTKDLLDAIRERHGLESDNQVAISLGIPQGTVSNWRRGRTFPTPVHAITLATALDLSPLEVLVISAADRSPDKRTREVWQRMLGHVVRMLATTAVGTGLLSAGYTPPARADVPALGIMSKRRRRASGAPQAVPQPA